MIARVIISGGQTGADRAALDAALELHVETGGWVPRGRRAEDGPVPENYPNLSETKSGHYELRSRYNVRDSDATLIVTHGELHGGSRFTRDVAEELGKPYLHMDLTAHSNDEAVAIVREWLSALDGDRLNVAGPRESSDPKIYQAVKKMMLAVLEHRETE